MKSRDRLSRWLLSGAAMGVTACASAPVIKPPPVPSVEQKLQVILRLEDQRILGAPPAQEQALVAASSKIRVPAQPAIPSDLVTLFKDADARVRRRAALAIGRVGLKSGGPVLVAGLADPDPEVRQMAAFGLGLLADSGAVAPLIQALKDPSPIVRGRAAESLGLIGDSSAASAIGEMVSGYVTQVATTSEDELGYPLAPEVEAFRLGVYALVRVKGNDALVSAVLDAERQVKVRWWPVAYAFQRLQDKRSLDVLLALTRSRGAYTRAFAARGLGALRDAKAVDTLIALTRAETSVAVQAVRALGQIGHPSAAPTLIGILGNNRAAYALQLEAVNALGNVKSDDSIDLLIDFVSHPSPPLRVAALQALGKAQSADFITMLSGLEPDPHWHVRATLATVLGTLPSESVLPRLRQMLEDSDLRVLPSVLGSLVKLRAPEASEQLLGRLKSDDVVVRKAAAEGLAALKVESAVPALTAAYQFGQRDTSYLARAAALEALAAFQDPSVAATLRKAAETDKDWAVRIRAAELLRKVDPTIDLENTMRPAPSGRPIDFGQIELIAPSVSPHAYIETTRGTIQIELAVLEAALTVQNFISLARKGFFTGLSIHRVVPDFVVQDGDPRGDGEGGPGYTIRDELNQLPYLRGTVGMALDWKDTGGSQFFITHSPQPHLDARYTVFGRVIAGMEVVDQLQQWEGIKQIRIWDGVTMIP